MKKLAISLFATAAFVVGISFSAEAQTVNSSASASLYATMNISNTQGLDFGTIYAPTGAATILYQYVYDGGLRIPTGVTLSDTDLGHAALFDITGTATQAYNVTLPTSDVTITNGTDDMIVNAFRFDANDIGDILNPVEIPSGGADVLEVVATLNLTAGLGGGEYTGTFDVTIAYN